MQGGLTREDLEASVTIAFTIVLALWWWCAVLMKGMAMQKQRAAPLLMMMQRPPEGRKRSRYLTGVWLLLACSSWIQVSKGGRHLCDKLRMEGSLWPLPESCFLIVLLILKRLDCSTLCSHEFLYYPF
ncbi:unnamed protein product [Musa acuminata subsp. burmannicoides]